MLQNEEEEKLPLLERILMIWMFAGIPISLIIWPFDYWFDINMKGVFLWAIVVPMIAVALVSQTRLESEMMDRE